MLHEHEKKSCFKWVFSFTILKTCFGYAYFIWQIVFYQKFINTCIFRCLPALVICTAITMWTSVVARQQTNPTRRHISFASAFGSKQHRIVLFVLLEINLGNYWIWAAATSLSFTSTVRLQLTAFTRRTQNLLCNVFERKTFFWRILLIFFTTNPSSILTIGIVLQHTWFSLIGCSEEQINDEPCKSCVGRGTSRIIYISKQFFEPAKLDFQLLYVWNRGQ